MQLAKRVVLRSAFIRYPLAEGIDVHKGKKLYMTCKCEKMLYILDLDSNKYVRYSLEIALFEGEPNGTTTLLNDTGKIKKTWVQFPGCMQEFP
jgi:hypothetical protein